VKKIVIWCLLLLLVLTSSTFSAQLGGTIKGRLCYPTDYIIPDMTIYARNTKTGKIYSTYVQQNTHTFRLDVPAGSYIVFVWTGTKKTLNRTGGSYSHAVPCGLKVSCSDHSPIPVIVKSGKVVKDIDPCDFYSEKDVPIP